MTERLYTHPQEPGAPGVGDVVVVGPAENVRGKWAHTNLDGGWLASYAGATVRVHSLSSDGDLRWLVRGRQQYQRVPHVRRPTPDELAAYLLSQGPAGPEGQP